MSDGEAARIERLLREAAGRCGGDERLWRHFLKGLREPVLRAIHHLWHWQAHGGQREPPALAGPDSAGWKVWLLMAGRGFGKTRAGAEWVSQRARENPKAAIALVGATRDEIAKVMIEGPSGLMATARTGEDPRWVPTTGQLSFASGATAFVYSAAAPESLRGPEHHFAWADELAKWPPSTSSGRAGKGEQAWDNLMMGLRAGDWPRAVVTTTPRTAPLVKRLLALDRVAVTRGRAQDNVHLSDDFVGWVRETYGRGRLGRQELDGELIEDVEGALFTRAVMEKSRVPPRGPATAFGGPAPSSGADLVRIVVGVDPPASREGACGIVVCGRDPGGMLYVLAHCSVSGLRPEGWALAVARAAESWGADRVIAEKNQGGDMVERVLRSANVMLPVKPVSGSRGKSARAEPVAALFEAGRARLAGTFPELEDELAGLIAGGGYEGPGRSPDRADACVWAMTELMGAPASPPRVTQL